MGRFAINQTTGRISEFYDLMIIVTDGGIPQMFGFAYANIIVLDFNDNHPMFAGDVLQGCLMESVEVGDSFYTVEAMDDNFGSNGVLEYFIVKDTLNISQRFTNVRRACTNNTSDRQSEHQLNITVVWKRSRSSI